MIELLHSETFRKNLLKWIFMYIAVICLLMSVITYSKFISSFGSDDAARSSKFNVKIEPIATQTSCPDDELSNSPEGTTTSILCSTSRPTSTLEYYFRVDVTDIEVKSEVYLRARAGDENYQTSSNKISNMLIEDISLCKDITCKEFEETKKINDKSGSITISIDGKNKDKKNIYYFKVNAKYDPSKFYKDEDGYISFSSDENTPVTDEVRIGFSAMQVE